MIRFYQVFLRAWMSGVCRYEPSCSEYAKEAIHRHGPWCGVALAIRRVASCHPFSRKSFLDPVPLKSSCSLDSKLNSFPPSSFEESCATRTI